MFSSSIVGSSDARYPHHPIQKEREDFLLVPVRAVDASFGEVARILHEMRTDAFVCRSRARFQ
jgi:hypothetical protein